MTITTATGGKSGAFEVYVKGEGDKDKQLVHSKLTMGHGKCQSDEELDAIIEHVAKKIG